MSVLWTVALWWVRTQMGVLCRPYQLMLTVVYRIFLLCSSSHVHMDATTRVRDLNLHCI